MSTKLFTPETNEDACLFEPEPQSRRPELTERPYIIAKMYFAIMELGNKMEVGAEIEDIQKESKSAAFVTRTENPLLTPLEKRPQNLQNFAQTVNEIITQHASTTIETPYVESVATSDGREIKFNSIEIPYYHLNPQKIESMRNLLKSIYATQRVAEGLAFDLPPEEASSVALLSHRIVSPRIAYHLTATPVKVVRGNPYQREGVFFVGKKEVPFVGTWHVQAAKLLSEKPKDGILEIHDFGSLAEAELAYLTVMSSLVVTGKLDLSQDEKMTETLPARRKIFLTCYKKMLAEMMPPTERGEIFGLNTQINDIETNLYSPLLQKKGRPMNTLLVGAPGVGKSLVARYFATNSETLTVPVSVQLLHKVDNNGKGIFETAVLPKLQRIGKSLGVPVVILMDDVEAILESGITVSPTGEKTQSIDPERRSKALNLLERMSDTHGIFLLASLNHPDVESAFLRRFNTVYFPLPSAEQRQNALKGIVKKGPLSAKDYDQLLQSLTEETEGFNYSAISLIPDYAKNYLATVGGDDNPASYRESLNFGVDKARERTNILKLAKFNQEAQDLTGQKPPKRKLGFRVAGKI